VNRLRVWLRDLWLGLRCACGRAPRGVKERINARGLSVSRHWNGRWAITFELDDRRQVWFTDSEEHARRFLQNLVLMGTENAELAG
jgi:hypothetical protein